jgi:hypothetical protein
MTSNDEIRGAVDGPVPVSPRRGPVEVVVRQVQGLEHGVAAAVVLEEVGDQDGGGVVEVLLLGEPLDRRVVGPGRARAARDDDDGAGDAGVHRAEGPVPAVRDVVDGVAVAEVELGAAQLAGEREVVGVRDRAAEHVGRDQDHGYRPDCLGVHIVSLWLTKSILGCCRHRSVTRRRRRRSMLDGSSDQLSTRAQARMVATRDILDGQARPRNRRTRRAGVGPRQAAGKGLSAAIECAGAIGCRRCCIRVSLWTAVLRGSGWRCRNGTQAGVARNHQVAPPARPSCAPCPRLPLSVWPPAEGPAAPARSAEPTWAAVQNGYRRARNVRLDLDAGVTRVERVEVRGLTGRRRARGRA